MTPLPGGRAAPAYVPLSAKKACIAVLAPWKFVAATFTWACVIACCTGGEVFDLAFCAYR